MDWLKLDDFASIEHELLDEFKAAVEPHIPDKMVILKKGWEDLFLFFKAAQSASMPDVAFHKQMQKLIGGWYSQAQSKGKMMDEKLISLDESKIAKMTVTVELVYEDGTGFEREFFMDPERVMEMDESRDKETKVPHLKIEGDYIGASNTPIKRSTF